MVTPAQEQQYGQDRDSLLVGCRRRSGRKFQVPAQMLSEAILTQGYTIQRCPEVPRGLLGYCAFRQRQVVLPTDFAQRLDYPRSWRQVMRATLAHELGHIRLHSEQAANGEQESTWELEANAYAQVFLVPRWQLQNHSALTALLAASRDEPQTVLWSYVLALAKHFKVSGGFMVHSLRLYGLVDFDRESRSVLPIKPPALT
jgi:hypothetical protein